MAYAYLSGQDLWVFSFCMKPWAEQFYKSTTWKNCRDSYMSQQKGLCEDCLEQNKVNPATEVHHVIELTPMNISDPCITLSYDNLKALCHDCHMKRHHKHEKRYTIDEFGRVTPND